MNYLKHITLIVLAFLAASLAHGQRGGPTATIIGSDSKVCVGDSVAAFVNCYGNEPFDLTINDSDGEYLVLEDVGSQTTIWLKPEKDEVYYIKEVRDVDGRKGKTYGEVAVSVYETTPVSILLTRTAYFVSEPGVTLSATPSGGIFSGNGVVGNTFYPAIATPVGSPHEIVYSYSNPNGCISTDQVNIYVLYGDAAVYLISGNDTVVALCDDGATYVIRGFNSDGAAGEFELREAGSAVSIEGHIIDEDPKDNEALLDPAGLSGLYDIFYTYTGRGITDQDSYRFLVNDLGVISIPDLPEEVCQGNEPYPLVPELDSGDPDATYSFSGPGVYGNQDEGFFFDPGLPEVETGEIEIHLEYTSGFGCSAIETFIVVVTPSPVIAFSFDPSCIPGSGGLVTFENLTGNKSDVENWGWDFGDPSSGADNYSNLENPTHFYSDPGPLQISLAATTTDGCLVRHTMDTFLYDVPMAEFSWLHDCFVQGEEIAFIDHSGSEYAPLDTLVWTFSDDMGKILGTEEKVNPMDTVWFGFGDPGSYTVKLHVVSEAGCMADTSGIVQLKPTIVLSDNPYEEGFNNTGHGWSAGTDNGNMSWQWGQPGFSGYTPVAGDRAWYTSLPVDQAGYVEPSWVESPCFDFSEAGSAILKMDLMKSFRPGLDGAVLQYKTGSAEAWTTLGQVGEGINWYNVNDLTLLPGGSPYGWGLVNFDPDENWVRATHDLGALRGLDHVRLRVALATGPSVTSIGNQGFAFDNLFIGEPFRMSLIEYFTNSASVVCFSTDGIVDQLTTNHPERVIDLQYHMDFPGVDPMNLSNPYPPSTRAFNYGIQEVPLAILNGGPDETYRFDFSEPGEEPDEEVLEAVSLDEPLFDLGLEANWMENSMEVTTVVTCRSADFHANLQLYVVLMESIVTADPGLNGDTVFRNVVLDMLPSPAGKLLGNSWYEGKTEILSYTWGYPVFVEDPEELAVVAFVQNRDEGGVLQVAVDYRTPVMGSGLPKPVSTSMRVYPNPALDLLTVQFQPEGDRDGQLQILDLTGKQVLAVPTGTGTGRYTLDVSTLHPGVYIICRMSKGMVLERSRILITR